MGHDALKNSNVARIAAILSSFRPANQSEAVGALLDRIGIKRSTGFALVRVLVARGYLERTGRGCIRLGPQVRSLSFAPLEHGYGARLPVTRISAKTSAQADKRPKLELLGNLTPDLIRSVPEGQHAKTGPWRLGFANASLSNAWRMALWRSLEYGIALHGEDILSFEAMHAHDDPDEQVAHIGALLRQGVDALIVSTAPDPRGQVARSLARAQETGIPVIAVDRRPKNRDAVTTFVTASDHMIGRVSALWLVEKLAGQGRIWMLSGLENASPAQRRASSAMEIFSAFPGIEVAFHGFTQWTATSGKRVVQDLLRGGAPAPNAVWCDSGLQGLGSLKAFEDAGCAIPPHTGGDLNGMYRKALKKNVPHCALDYPAAMGAQSVSVALDLLRGRAVARRVETPVPVIMPRGQETASVKADIWAERHVLWDLPDDVILSQGASIRSATREGTP